MIVGEGTRTVGLGLIIGVARSVALTRLLSSVLFGVTALDPVTFLTVIGLLLLLALSACWAGFPGHTRESGRGAAAGLIAGVAANVIDGRAGRKCYN
jgi:hypothetical protein